MNKYCVVNYHYIDDEGHIDDENNNYKATAIEVWVQEHLVVAYTIGEPFDIPDKYIKTFPPTPKGLEKAEAYAEELCMKNDTPEKPWEVNGLY